MVTKTNQMF
jgi:hypothetical protein